MRVSEQSETRFLFRNLGGFPQFLLPGRRRLGAFSPSGVLLGACDRHVAKLFLGRADVAGRFAFASARLGAQVAELERKIPVGKGG